MGRVARAIIANGGILAQSYTDSRELRKTCQHIFSVLRKAKYLFRNFIHVEPNKVVTVGVVQDRETPRVLEGHQVGFTGVKVKMQDFKQSNLLLSDLRTVNDFA